MMGISIFLPYKIWNFMKWLKIFPSQRHDKKNQKAIGA
ncbi:hypothetical protein M899_0558 [Bacteriovorax sp. BSW11_IV]|nr:hypothetical protein M899_0558 [Bacteriovorax sp. BSW11_IV]